MDIKVQDLAHCVEGTVNHFVYGLYTFTLGTPADLSIFELFDTNSFVRVTTSELQAISEHFQIVDGVMLGCNAQFMPMIYANYFDSTEVTIILSELLSVVRCRKIISSLKKKYPEVAFEVKSKIY